MVRARTGPSRVSSQEWKTATSRVCASTSSTKTMSAWLSPTWGRAAEVFSTLTAITGLPLTLPPVSGSL